MSNNKSLIKRAKKDTRLAKWEAKQAQKQAQKIAKAQIKEMRPYLKALRKVDLRKTIGSSQRGYINKAWQEYQELTARPFKVYRSKSNKRLKIAQAYSRHEKGKPKFDVAFVPTADTKAKLIFKDDRLIIKSKYVTETVLFFDLRKLAIDPQQEIKDTLARNKDAKQFIIMAGKYLYNGGLARSLVEEKVVNMMQRYSPGGQGYEKRGPNSHYQNWLFGIVAFTATEQASINAYRQAYAKKSLAAKDKKKSERRKRGLTYGKKF